MPGDFAGSFGGRVERDAFAFVIRDERHQTHAWPPTTGRRRWPGTREAQDGSAGPFYRRAFHGERDDLAALQPKYLSHEVRSTGPEGAEPD